MNYLCYDQSRPSGKFLNLFILVIHNNYDLKILCGDKEWYLGHQIIN